MERDLAGWISEIPLPSHLSNPAASSFPTPRRQVVRPTHWPSTSFVLAAGTVTFQPSTGKVLLVEDTARRQPYWFLPRGRKNVGETLENCALRETFEEAGYKSSLFSAPTFTRQPTPDNHDELPLHSEAFHVQLIPLLSRRGNTRTTMYLAFWYLCLLPEIVARDVDYGRGFLGRHEAGYRSALVNIEHAVHLLSDGRFTYHSSEEINYQGVVLDENGKEVNWDGVAGGDNGGVQALLVARGWEHVRMGMEEEGEDNGSGKFTQSVFESENESDGGSDLVVAVGVRLSQAVNALKFRAEQE